ncbi:hypothetical protein [Leptospirillum ferrooxidans]|uniref:Uncharacterized protein n=1 Tax=Leptospirillum ferrooxidans (strain C2-3) TaxID=1162668 RepID=I0INX6_LEPFC|nr:hypothetical protein [Leptospirillum ferrooxidans]BAM06975.1 hypothetical protein LFE_1292 [Leptospirillum ferrooxidans C2-3]
MGRLVDHVLSDLFCVSESPDKTLPGLSPTVRAFDLSGQFLLPAFSAQFLLSIRVFWTEEKSIFRSELAMTGIITSRSKSKVLLRSSSSVNKPGDGVLIL